MEPYTLQPAAVIPVQVAGREPKNFDIYGTVEIIREMQAKSADHRSFLIELGRYIAGVLEVAEDQIGLNQVSEFHSLIVQAYNAIYEHTKKNDGSTACLQQLIPGYQANSLDGTT